MIEEEQEIIEALTKRVQFSIDAEGTMMNIPIPATDRAMKTLLDARRAFIKPKKKNVLRSLAEKAHESAMALYPVKKRKRRKSGNT